MSRPKATLGEVMGRKAEKANESGLSLDDLPEILGEAMPELPKSSVGRFRLVRALRNRFGSNYRALPGVKGILKEFDDNLADAKVIEKIKGIRVKRG